jgi:RNA polymerase sigma-70 factor (ECF subfamily)
MSDSTQFWELINAAVRGDSVSLEQLLIDHFAPLERYLRLRIPTDMQRHLGAEDILQETFAQAFRDIRQFRPGDEVAFLAWLKTIADHRLSDAIKLLGRKKRGGDKHQLSSRDVAKTSTAALIDVVCHDSHLPDDSAQRHEMEKAVHVALASLPAIQRDVLQARFIGGMDVDHIAAQTGRTPAAVRGLIRRGKEKLAEAMGRSSRWLGR